MKNKDQIVLENIYQRIKEQYDAPQAVPPAQVSKEKSSMGSMMGDIFRAAYTDTLKQRGYTDEQIKKYWEEFDKHDKNKKTSNGEIDFQNPEVQNKVKQAYKQKGYTDEDLKMLDSLFKPEKINSLKSSMLANGIDINKILKESIDTKHQVGGEHWGELKDDEGNSHYLYVKDIIDAANKTVKTEKVPTDKFEKPGIARPENVKKYAETMKEGKWDWNKSGPIYATFWQGKYGMFDGNHRLAAAQMAGLKEVPIKNVGSIIDTTIANKKEKKPTVIGGITIRTK